MFRIETQPVNISEKLIEPHSQASMNEMPDQVGHDVQARAVYVYLLIVLV